MTTILGLSCFYHDSAACLLQDGKIIAAAHEERFTRKKHDASYPQNAISFCLSHAGITSKDLDWVSYYEKPFIKFDRILSTHLSQAPFGLASFLKSMPIWIKEKLWISALIQKKIKYSGKIIFPEHHEAHAASSFFCSPFEEAAIMTLDGVGEWSTTTAGVGRGNQIVLQKEIHFPHSLGLLYSAFTYFLGFKVNSAEYKVMGLAPYGNPKYVDLIKKHLIEIKDDGSFKLNLSYFSYTYGLKMIHRRFGDLFNRKPRKPEDPLTQDDFDIAASIQKVTEEVVLKIAKSIRKETGMKNLCLAGGVALNCVANGKVLREAGYEDIFIQPAAGDAGGAVGAAAFAYYSLLNQKRNVQTMPHPFLGPSFSDDDIEKELLQCNAVYEKLSTHELLQKTARAIADQQVIGWFQGRAEFGPRALGGRSILADPRNKEMKDIVNLKIKFREGFRPFAPTVLAEYVQDYFELTQESPYMLLTAQVRQDKRILPSVTHVDGSARVQTIKREDHPLYYDLIQEFYNLTGVPVVINTSFNVRGEPLVGSPKDAFQCFMGTHMDSLVIGHFFLEKKNQSNIKVFENYHKSFPLD